MADSLPYTHLYTDAAGVTHFAQFLAVCSGGNCVVRIAQIR